MADVAVSAELRIADLLSEELHGLVAQTGEAQDLDPRARQHAALLAFGRRTNARPPSSVLVQDAVSLLVEILDTNLGGHSEVVADGGLILRAFALDENRRPLSCGSRELPLDPTRSMAGYVLHTATPVTSDCVSSERRFTDLFLREKGVVSGLSVPLPVDQTAYGTIEVYCTERRIFTQPDIRFAETIAHLLTASIGRMRAEEQLRCERMAASAVMETVQTVVIVLDDQGRIQNLNTVAEQTTGFAVEELRKRSFWGTLVPAEDMEAFQSALRELQAQHPAQLQAHLLTKENQKLQLHWNLRAVSRPNGTLQAVVLSGTMNATNDMLPFSVQSPTKGPELRSSPRRTFTYRQLIAPMYTGVIPSRNKFFEVPCHDISAGGISFYLNSKPDFDTLLVALGKTPSLTYFTARVVRIVEEVIDGHVMQLVGCRFTGRVHL